MKVLTIKSVEALDEEMRNEVHHSLGMEHYTDYVFQPRAAQKYSATIVLEESGPVIEKIKQGSRSFPGLEFLIDDLDMDQNTIERYRLKHGKTLGYQRTGWKWSENNR